MCITEYNEERTMQTFLNNGIALGRAEGRFDMLFQLVKQGLLSPESAAENASVPLSVFLRMMERYNQSIETNIHFSME